MNKQLIKELTHVAQTGERIRYFYGNQVTGQEVPVMEYSQGIIECNNGVFTMRYNESNPYSQIIDLSKIVKLTKDKKVIWQVSNYKAPSITYYDFEEIKWGNNMQYNQVSTITNTNQMLAGKQYVRKFYSIAPVMQEIYAIPLKGDFSKKTKNIQDYISGIKNKK